MIDLSMFHSSGGTGLFERRNWVAHCTSPRPVRPDRLTHAAYNKLSTSAQQDYDAQRQRWLSEWDFHVPHASALRIGEAIKVALAETEFNTTGQGAVIGIDGEFGAGKTSLALRILRNKQEDLMKGVSDDDYIDHLPVVVGQAQVGGQYRPLIQNLARFTHAPITGREDYAESFDLFLNGVQDKGLRLLLLDEAQRMSLRDSKRRTGSGVVKDFMERFPNIVVVLVGSRLATEGPFADEDCQQLAARGSIYTVEPFDNGNADENKVWRTWVKQLGENIPLTKKSEPLSDVAEVLWDRTGGLAGATARLVKTASIRAMLKKTEEITIDLLDSIEVPMEVQSYAKARKGMRDSDRKHAAAKNRDESRPPNRRDQTTGSKGTTGGTAAATVAG